MANPSTVSLRSPLLKRATLGGLSVAGLVAGHCFALQFFAAPAPPAHHQAPTHSHAPYVATLLVGLLVAAIGAFVDHRLHRRRIGSIASGVILGVAQLVGYLGLVAFDGGGQGNPMSYGGRLFWIGLVIQVVVAGLGALVLVFLRGTVELLDALLTRRRRPRRRSLRPFFSPVPVFARPGLAMGAGGPTYRGPPLSE